MLTIIGIILASFSLMTQSGTLEIEVNNIKQDKGTIRIALFQGEENFLKEGEELHPQVLNVTNTDAIQLEIPNVQFGTYALAVYHDVNNNGKLDKNFMGIPSEPYSFSNNPKIKWKGPSYEGTRFNFNDNNRTLKLELRKWSKQ